MSASGSSTQFGCFEVSGNVWCVVRSLLREFYVDWALMSTDVDWAKSWHRAASRFLLVSTGVSHGTSPAQVLRHSRGRHCSHRTCVGQTEEKALQLSLGPVWVSNICLFEDIHTIWGHLISKHPQIDHISLDHPVWVSWLAIPK